MGQSRTSRSPSPLWGGNEGGCSPYRRSICGIPFFSISSKLSSYPASAYRMTPSEVSLVCTCLSRSAPSGVPSAIVVTPALVVVDVLVVGRNLLDVRWWSALGWLAPPLAYLVYYNVWDIDAYDIALGRK